MGRAGRGDQTRTHKPGHSRAVAGPPRQTGRERRVEVRAHGAGNHPRRNRREFGRTGVPAHLCAHRPPDGTEPGGTGLVGSDKKKNNRKSQPAHAVTEARHRAVTWAARGSGRVAGCRWGRHHYLPWCEDQGVRASGKGAGKHALLSRPHRAPDLLSPPSSSSRTPWGPTLSCSLLSPRACPHGPRPGQSPDVQERRRPDCVQSTWASNASSRTDTSAQLQPRAAPSTGISPRRPHCFTFNATHTRRLLVPPESSPLLPSPHQSLHCLGFRVRVISQTSLPVPLTYPQSLSPAISASETFAGRSHS